MVIQFAKSMVGLLPQNLQNDIRLFRNWQKKNEIISNWERSGKPAPPPHQVKQATIKNYQTKSKYEILVETGTFMGDMVNAQRKNFKKIYSIELGEKLWQAAVKRFAGYKHIKILQGDSGKVLNSIIPDLQKPAIFWLDGHFSDGITAKGEKDCPIYEEIDAIFKGNHFDHILLIDDARLFVGKYDYPTLEELIKCIHSKDPRYKISVQNDIICCEI